MTEKYKIFYPQDRLEIFKSELTNMTLYERLWDKDVWVLLVKQTNIYATQKNNHEFFVSEQDMKIFIGSLLPRFPREC